MALLANKQVHYKRFAVPLTKGGEARVNLMLQIVNNYVEYYQTIKNEFQQNALTFKENVETFKLMLNKLLRLFPAMMKENKAATGVQHAPYRDNQPYIQRDDPFGYQRDSIPPKDFMMIDNDSDYRANDYQDIYKAPQAKAGPPQVKQFDLKNSGFSIKGPQRSLTHGSVNSHIQSDQMVRRAPQQSSSLYSNHPGIEGTEHLGNDSGYYKPVVQPQMRENRGPGWTDPYLGSQPNELVAYNVPPQLSRRKQR